MSWIIQYAVETNCLLPDPVPISIWPLERVIGLSEPLNMEAGSAGLFTIGYSCLSFQNAQGTSVWGSVES